MAPQRNLSSYIDPAGTVYESDGKVLRGIRPDFAAFYAALLEKPVIQSLLKSTLADTQVATESLRDYPLTLEHHKVEPLSFCYEWPPQMLKDAGLLTLDLCLTLSEHQLVLQDAYPWNVLFEGSRPVFVDFTSITSEDLHLLWVAYDQFCRFFLFPLAIAHQRSGKLARTLLIDYIDGISAYDLRKILSWSAMLRLPWLFKRVYLTQMIVTILQGAKKGKSLVDLSLKMVPTLKMRQAFFSSLKKDMQGLSTHVGKSFWSAYYADIETFFKPEAFDVKQATVAHLLEQLQPKTVVDIGCNRGGYAILAALAGARVSAFDKDEDSITLLYELAKKRKLAILPLVIDLLCPSPSCGWRAIQFPAAPERLHAEMALALALTHHLAITQRQTFERIVAALADYSEKWLLTEFVPLEDPRAQEIMLTHKRDMRWYSLDAFLDALRNVYRQVETFPSHPDGRILILCTK